MLKSTFAHFRSAFSGIPTAVWLLSLVNLINRSGAMVVCFLTLYLTEFLKFDLVSAGYAMACYGLGSIAGAYVGGYLTDRLGYYRVQWITLLGGGVMLLFLMLVRDFWSVCAMITVWSAVSEAFRPANSVAIRMYSDESTRTRAFSLLRVSVNLAISIALIFGGLLISIGWHWLFWADALTCFAATAIVLIFVKNNQTTPQYKTSEKPTDAPAENDNSAYKDADYLLFIAMTFIGAMVFMQIVWTVPAFFKQSYGWSESMIGGVAAVNGITVMFVEMPLVFRIEGWRPQLTLVRIGIVLYAISYLLFTLPASMGFISAIAYMVVISFGEIFVMPFSSTWATFRAGERRQGQYMALYGMAYSVSNVLAPMLGTQIIDRFGFNALWVVLALMCGVAYWGFSRLEKRQA